MHASVCKAPTALQESDHRRRGLISQGLLQFHILIYASQHYLKLVCELDGLQLRLLMYQRQDDTLELGHILQVLLAAVAGLGLVAALGEDYQLGLVRLKPGGIFLQGCVRNLCIESHMKAHVGSVSQRPSSWIHAAH